jgi:hypothetical protein
MSSTFELKSAHVNLQMWVNELAFGRQGIKNLKSSYNPLVMVLRFDIMFYASRG